MHSFRHPNQFAAFPFRAKYLITFCCPCIIDERNKLSPKIRKIRKGISFEKSKFIRPPESKIFNIHEEVSIKRLT